MITFAEVLTAVSSGVIMLTGLALFVLSMFIVGGVSYKALRYIARWLGFEDFYFK